MDRPPARLDGADVLCWTVSRRGGFYTHANLDPPVVVVAMAVARYAEGGPFYLFKCDAAWEVFGDFDCESVAEARGIAAGHAGGEALVWYPVAGSSD